MATVKDWGSWGSKGVAEGRMGLSLSESAVPVPVLSC